MRRIYESVLQEHFNHYNKMLFLAGPRQVGKTTIAMKAKSLFDQCIYLNWDNFDDQQLILNGPNAIAEYTSLQKISDKTTVIIFDEIHKFSKWKSFLKGFFDTFHQRTKIIVTGSAKLNVYRAGNDSMMGRYFLYRVHPLSIAECSRTQLSKKEIQSVKKFKSEHFQNLLTYGGFPEPYLEKNRRFYNRWKNLITQQVFREDLRDLTHIQESSQLEMLAHLIKLQASQLINYSSLATKIRVSSHTVQHWLKALNNVYFCFTIQPWSKNIARSLLKQPKIYLWDWSDIQDKGARAENFVACHLLKAVHFWTDSGLGNYQLYFLRDKEQNEVDFLITKNQQPWILIEVKNSQHSSINKNLLKFQKQLEAKYAFQAVFDMNDINQNCFVYTQPIIVPIQTLLSQFI